MHVNDKQRYTFSHNLVFLMMTYDGAGETPGITQTELAKALNVGQTTISGWIACNTFPRDATLERIAIFFGLTIDELINKDLELADTALIIMADDDSLEKAKQIENELLQNDPYSEWVELKINHEELLKETSVVRPFLKTLNKLNSKGVKKVKAYVEDLAKLPEYRKK